MNGNQIFAQGIGKSVPVLQALTAAGLDAMQLSVTADGALHVHIAYPENDLTAEARRELNEVRRYEYLAPQRIAPALGPEWDEDPLSPVGLQHWTFTVEANDTYGAATTRACEDLYRHPYSPGFTEHVKEFFEHLRSVLQSKDKEQRRAPKRERQAVCC